MTEATDTKALRDKHALALKDLTERLTECNRQSYCWDELSALAAFSSTVIDQLEAERQQREATEAAAQAMRDDMRVARDELSALRGTQEPVVLTDDTVLDWGYRNDIKGDVSKLRCMIDDAASLGNYQTSRQPKPVVVLPPRRSATSFVDDEFTNADLAAIYNAARLEFKVILQNSGIVVKDGE